jgi:hypothetical protein
VEQVIECEVAGPLPLARRHIGGLALHDGRIFVTVVLGQSVSELSRRWVQGVLLVTPGSKASFLLEVSRVRGLVAVDALADGADGADRGAGTTGGNGKGGHDPASSSPAPTPPSWLRPAKARDGRTLVWVAVDEMARQLAGGPHVD